MLALLRTNRDLRWLFVAQVVSFMGDWFTFVVLAGMVKDATGSEFLVSLAYVSFSLPAFLASPIAGPVVDRFDRRRLLVIISGMQAVAALGLLTASPSHVWPLFLFQGTISALAAFVKPAIDAGVPNVARNPEELRKANVLFGSTWGVMLAVGAALGGVFSEAFGRQAAFIADAVSFVIAMALFALIRGRLQEQQHAHRAPINVVADMKEAGSYARKDHAVLALLASKATFAIGAGTVSQLPVLATRCTGGATAGQVCCWRRAAWAPGSARWWQVRADARVLRGACPGSASASSLYPGRGMGAGHLSRRSPSPSPTSAAARNGR